MPRSGTITHDRRVTSQTPSVTRGHGLLEEFLAHQRRRQADRHMDEEARAGRLLDIGCGSYPLFLLNTRFAEKYGLDRVTPPELSGSGLTFVEHDVAATTTLPFEAGFFETVTMLAVFEHLEPPILINLLREIRRVLRSGGAYLLTTPAAWTGGILDMMARLKLVSHVEVGEHKGSYSHRQIVALLTEAGFDPALMSYGFFEVGMNLWVKARVGG